VSCQAFSDLQHVYLSYKIPIILLPSGSLDLSLSGNSQISSKMSDYIKSEQLSKHFWYVYILKCIDGSNYTGCTNNLEDRIKRHNSGQVEATKNILPVEILNHFAFTDKYKAFNFEKYLKSGSGRAFSKRHFQ
jgi:predicted GIY-YIG superfamily endonuclease